MTLTQVLLVVALVLLAGVLMYSRANRSGRTSISGIRRQLVSGVDVGGQVSPGDIAGLKEQGYRTIINMRPDGEGAEQPASADVARVAVDAGMTYAYIPTSAANMPDTVIDDLQRTLADAERPVLIYCRSGARVARAWALAEASQPDGFDRERIVEAVEQAGFKADDLLPRIEARLAARPK